MRRFWVMMGCVCALAGGAGIAGAAEVLEPPDGSRYSGVSTPDQRAAMDSFLEVSGQPSVAIANRFAGKNLTNIRWLLDDFGDMDAIGMVSWFNFQGEYSSTAPGGSSASVARGDIDASIVARAGEIRAYGRPLFVRMNWEMNGTWFAFSPYTSSGTLRAGNEPAHYVAAWRRTVEIFRGGTRADINARLRALGQPDLNAAVAGSTFTATDNVAWVWCPAKETKFQDRQSVHAFYPGDTYVDWVGVDWYGYGPHDEGHHATVAGAPQGANEIYDRYSGPASHAEKPFVLAEWGVRDYDRDAWTADMFAWIAARPQVKAQLYFNVFAADGNSRLEDHPLSAAAFRSGVCGTTWLRRGSEVRTYAPGEPAPASLPCAAGTPGGAGGDTPGGGGVGGGGAGGAVGEDVSGTPIRSGAERSETRDADAAHEGGIAGETTRRGPDPADGAANAARRACSVRLLPTPRLRRGLVTIAVACRPGARGATLAVVGETTRVWRTGAARWRVRIQMRRAGSRVLTLRVSDALASIEHRVVVYATGRPGRLSVRLHTAD